MAGDIVAALVLLVVGVPALLKPYPLARFGEQLDAIGSKRAPERIEPADWNVGVTRAMGLLFTFFGTILLSSILFD